MLDRQFPYEYVRRTHRVSSVCVRAATLLMLGWKPLWAKFVAILRHAPAYCLLADSATALGSCVAMTTP